MIPGDQEQLKFPGYGQFFSVSGHCKGNLIVVDRHKFYPSLPRNLMIYIRNSFVIRITLVRKNVKQPGFYPPKNVQPGVSRFKIPGLKNRGYNFRSIDFCKPGVSMMLTGMGHGSGLTGNRNMVLGYMPVPIRNNFSVLGHISVPIGNRWGVIGHLSGLIRNTKKGNGLVTVPTGNRK
jgi:hypothetical protein